MSPPQGITFVALQVGLASTLPQMGLDWDRDILFWHILARDYST